MKQFLVDLLIKKIIEGGINPKTKEPYKLEDIKIPEYKTAVEDEILKRQQVI